MKTFKQFVTEAQLKSYSMDHSFGWQTHKNEKATSVRRTLTKLGYQKTGDMKAPANPARYEVGGYVIGSKHEHPAGHKASVNDNYRVTMHAPIEHHNAVRAAMGIRALDVNKAHQKHTTFTSWRDARRKNK